MGFPASVSPAGAREGTPLGGAAPDGSSPLPRPSAEHSSGSGVRSLTSAVPGPLLRSASPGGVRGGRGEGVRRPALVSGSGAQGARLAECGARDEWESVLPGLPHCPASGSSSCGCAAGRAGSPGPLAAQVERGAASSAPLARRPAGDRSAPQAASGAPTRAPNCALCARGVQGPEPAGSRLRFRPWSLRSERAMGEGRTRLLLAARVQWLRRQGLGRTDPRSEYSQFVSMPREKEKLSFLCTDKPAPSLTLPIGLSHPSVARLLAKW